MNRTIVLTAVVLLLGACRNHTLPNDDPKPESGTANPDAPTAPVQTAAIQYHRDEDRGPRVYVPLDTAPCQAVEAANVTYRPTTIWRFDGESSSWVLVEFGTAENWKIGCNAMADLADIIGLDLEPGTYSIAAEVNGKLQRGVIYEGPVECNDVALGDAPAGQVALCIMAPNSAEARFVPDPSLLEP